jgi:hypothetical protein
VSDTAATADQFCQQCHARVFAAAKATACPACGGSLLAYPGPSLDSPDAPPAQIDHRGIVLPRRHAVGGIITPR